MTEFMTIRFSFSSSNLASLGLFGCFGILHIFKGMYDLTPSKETIYHLPS